MPYPSYFNMNGINILPAELRRSTREKYYELLTSAICISYVSVGRRFSCQRGRSKEASLAKEFYTQRSEEQKHEVVVVAEVHLVDQLAGRIGKVMQMVMPASKDMPPDTDS